MNHISENQADESSVKIAAAFRYAYSRAKFWKSWIWAGTFVLSILQLLLAFKHSGLTHILPSSLPAIVISISVFTVFVSTIGKHFFVRKFVLIGADLQRLHDYEVLGIGTKPTELEVSQSLIERYSSSWLKNHENDRNNLINWWPASVSRVSKGAGISLCLLSTFRWEDELRKKYQLLLLSIAGIIFLVSLLLMHLMGLVLSEYIVQILVPLLPFISLLVDEVLITRSGIEVSKKAKDDAFHLWGKYKNDQNIAYEIVDFNQIIYLWGSYRSAVSPIFDWLYWVSQKSMDADMVINVDSLAEQFQVSDS